MRTCNMYMHILGHVRDPNMDGVLVQHDKMHRWQKWDSSQLGQRTRQHEALRSPSDRPRSLGHSSRRVAASDTPRIVSWFIAHPLSHQSPTAGRDVPRPEVLCLSAHPPFLIPRSIPPQGNKCRGREQRQAIDSPGGSKIGLVAYLTCLFSTRHGPNFPNSQPLRLACRIQQETALVTH